MTDEPHHDGPERERRARLIWVGAIVALLGLSVSVHGVLLYFATSDPSFAVEPDYEARAARWDEERAAQRASDELGWAATITLRPARARHTAELAVALADASGDPITDAHVRARVFHNARAADAVDVILDRRDDGGYDAILPARRGGIWIVEMSAVRGDDAWRATVRRMLATPDGGGR